MLEAAEDDPSSLIHASDSEEETEVVDYRLLNAVLAKKDYTLPSRGEKDFEPDGTHKQDASLEASRSAMYTALAAERDISAKTYIRAKWHADLCLASLDAQDARGTMFKSMGRTDKHRVTWLLPEEVLYLIDRGNVECFYENVEVPMSLQAAYAECIPHIGVERFQVYAYLKRAGYMVLRSNTEPVIPSDIQRESKHDYSLNLRLTALLSRLRAALSPMPIHGPLSRHKVYRSWQDVYSQLAFVPCHVFDQQSPHISEAGSGHSLKLSYDVWKPNTSFRKSAPGEPDFRLAVLDSRDHGVCSLVELDALFRTLKQDQKYDSMPQFTKLKHGIKTFVLAIADMGVVSFMSMGDVSFGSESVYTEYRPIVTKTKSKASIKRKPEPSTKS